MPGTSQYAECNGVGYSTRQLGEDDLLHNSGQQADIPVRSLQHAVLLEAVEQQRLKPEHVLEICTLILGRGGEREKRQVDFRVVFPLSFQKYKRSTKSMRTPYLKRVPCDQLQAD